MGRLAILAVVAILSGSVFAGEVFASDVDVPLGMVATMSNGKSMCLDARVRNRDERVLAENWIMNVKKSNPSLPLTFSVVEKDGIQFLSVKGDMSHLAPAWKAFGNLGSYVKHNPPLTLTVRRENGSTVVDRKLFPGDVSPNFYSENHRVSISYLPLPNNGIIPVIGVFTVNSGSPENPVAPGNCLSGPLPKVMTVGKPFSYTVGSERFTILFTR